MRRPPEQPAIYFLDENVDRPLLADALRAEGFEVRQHRACFEQGAEDESWIPALASHGWIRVRARLENYISKRLPPMIVFVRLDRSIELKEGGARRGGKQKP